MPFRYQIKGYFSWNLKIHPPQLETLSLLRKPLLRSIHNRSPVCTNVVPSWKYRRHVKNWSVECTQLNCGAPVKETRLPLLLLLLLLPSSNKPANNDRMAISSCSVPCCWLTTEWLKEWEAAAATRHHSLAAVLAFIPRDNRQSARDALQTSE